MFIITGINMFPLYVSYVFILKFNIGRYLEASKTLKLFDPLYEYMYYKKLFIPSIQEIHIFPMVLRFSLSERGSTGHDHHPLGDTRHVGRIKR